jgi:TonB family protein
MLDRYAFVAAITVAAVSRLDAAPQVKVYWEAEVDKLPLLVLHELPNPALLPGQSVSVTASWVVTAEGKVEGARILASGTPQIDTMVLEAVARWTYEPGLKRGKPVAVRVMRKYVFPIPDTSR